MCPREIKFNDTAWNALATLYVHWHKNGDDQRPDNALT